MLGRATACSTSTPTSTRPRIRCSRRSTWRASNDKPADKADLFKILSWTEPKDVEDDDAPRQVQAERYEQPTSSYDMWRHRPAARRACARCLGHANRHVAARSAAASRQRPHARAAVRADRARLHADRRADGADQPGARLAVRARRLLRAMRLLAPQLAARRPISRRPGSRCRSAGATRWRSSSRPSWSALVGMRARALHAPHLRQGPALRPAAHLRRGAGDRGADPPGLGHARLRAAGAARRSPAASSARRPDLVDLPLLRRRLRGRARSRCSGCFIEKHAATAP